MTAPEDFRGLLEGLRTAHAAADRLAGSLDGVEGSAALELRLDLALAFKKARGLAVVAGRLPPSEVELGS